LSRGAVVGVMLALSAVVVISFLVRQWEGSGGQLPAALVALGFENVFRTWWFLAISALAAVQLALVTVRLAARDVRRLRRLRGPAAGEPVAVTDTPALEHVLHSERYLRMHHGEAGGRWVKNPWGYLGPSVLHAGMLLAMIAVLVMSLGSSKGLVTVAVGQVVPAGTTLEAAEHGLLGDEAVLPAQLTLDDLQVTYWGDGEVRSIRGMYTLGEDASARTFAASVNRPVVVGGVRYFQDQRFGEAYFISLSRNGAVEKRRLTLPQPTGNDTRSYQDVTLDNGDLLRAKLTLKPGTSESPLLTLRLVSDDRILGEASFEETSAVLGDASVTIDFQSPWTILVLERGGAMWLFGLAAFTIFAGALLIYLTPPRELTVVRRDDDCIEAFWYAARFGSILAPEADRVRRAAEGDES
jgi:hypothetical protein